MIRLLKHEKACFRPNGIIMQQIVYILTILTHCSFQTKGLVYLVGVEEFSPKLEKGPAAVKLGKHDIPLD